MYKDWHLGMIEDAGYMDTPHSLNMRIARYLAKHGSDEIENDEFFDACIACNVDPNSMTSGDAVEIQMILNELT